MRLVFVFENHSHAIALRCLAKGKGRILDLYILVGRDGIGVIQVNFREKTMTPPSEEPQRDFAAAGTPDGGGRKRSRGTGPRGLNDLSSGSLNLKK